MNLFGLFLSFTVSLIVHRTSTALSLSPGGPNYRTYHYFAIGSNMIPATMTALRNLQPLAPPTAAVLPDYELVFDVPGGLIEPSAASVRPSRADLVLGVLYELSEEDFGRLGASEGVPLAYLWKACQVIPFDGDGEQAGYHALVAATAEGPANTAGVDAYVLTASPLSKFSRRGDGGGDIPPSRSYLRLLQEGATYWKMDRDYQQQLAEVPSSKMSPGVSWQLLQAARCLNRGSEPRAT